MPRRYGKKYSSYRRSRRYGRRHAAAASSIARAWRIRKRRKTPLVSRTVLSNRRQIRKIKSSIETKVLDDTVASLANTFQSGLSCGGVNVDENGQYVDYTAAPGPTGLFPNGPFVCDLMSPLSQGSGNDERVGAWIAMKSLTLKYCITADTRTAKGFFGLLLVLDRQPTVGNASLRGVLQKTGAGPLTTQPNAIAMSFYDVPNTTDKDGRYKVLWHKKHAWSCLGLQRSQGPVPPIQTAAAGTTPDVYGNVTRATYTPSAYVSSSQGAPYMIYGSKTLKIPYKLNYGNDNSTQCENQTILLMAYQCGSVADNACNPGGPRATLQFRGRFRFKDA